MATAEQIASFPDDTPPPGCSPWVAGGPSPMVAVVDADPAWPAWFDRLESVVRGALGLRVLGLDHIGSTSVPDLPAKPVIDIDLVVADPDDEGGYVPALEAAGFVLWVREPWWDGHRLLRHPEPACNLHVFGPDSAGPWRDRVFRDWLRTHDGDRDRYAAVKREASAAAVAAGEHAMGYNARKQDVIREIHARAFTAAGLVVG